MNDYSIDLLYLGKISHHLKQFKKKTDTVWNCRCPICGDSEKSKFKARGYFLKKKDTLFFYCQNCLASHPLWRLMKLYYPQEYGSYIFAKFTKQDEINDTRTERVIPSALPVFKAATVFGNCLPISDLPDTDAAKRYIRTRRIPRHFERVLLLTRDFKATCTACAPEKAKELKAEERIIIPYYDAENKLIGFQGRSLNPKDKLRYITIKLDETQPMIFGLDRVDMTQRVYVLEGPLDSLFVDNAIAASGSSLLRFNLKDVDAVYVHDNQPRNKEIVAIMEKSIDAGKTVVVWPSSFRHKDINDAVMAGMSRESIMDLINTSSYTGLDAKLRYNKWKKI